MTRLIVGVVVAVAVTSSAWAQESASPGARLQWTQADTDAPALAYLLTVDPAMAPIILSGVVCVETTPPEHTCTGDLPAMTVGPHDLVLVARRVVSGADFDSLPSEPLSIIFAPLPAQPGGLEIIWPVTLSVR